MARPRRRASKEGFRVCNRCERELPATPENFVKDSSRTYGVGYECLPCHSARRVGRDRSKERPTALTGEARERLAARSRRYQQTARGRAGWMRARYRQLDSCDFTLDEMEAILRQPCTYCDTVERPRGLDRIDNSKGHDKGNVLPCCRNCNSVRGFRRTPEETREIVQRRLNS